MGKLAKRQPANDAAQAWADRINAAVATGAMVGAILAGGRELIAAKEDLQHGEWLRMFRDHEHPVKRPLSFTASTGQRMMIIEAHPILRNTAHAQYLPPSWYTLYELSKKRYLPILEAALADGRIHPDMERKDVRALLPKRPREWGDGLGNLEIRQGRFQDVLADLSDGSVDLVLTDPPYGEEFLREVADLGPFAARVLKPGGSLLSYSGQALLPDVLDLLRPHLRYWWTLALDHRHGGQQLPGKWVLIEWKPIVWFVRDYRSGDHYIGDRVRGSVPEKHLGHPWAQGVKEVFYLVEALTKPGDLIVDPFAGTGAFGKAAVHLGRNFIGADLG